MSPRTIRPPKQPTWVARQPTPTVEERNVNGSPMKGWICQVDLQKIHAYLDNRRTESQVAELRKLKALKVPSDDELFEYIKDDPSLEIEQLAKDIMRDGLRVPVIISYDGVLLDGNRRYFAHRWLIQNAPTQMRHKFQKIKAWVLYKQFSGKDDKLRVIVDYNFRDDQKRPWNDYVKAKLLWDEQNEHKYTYEELTELYGAPGFGRPKIIEFVKTYELIALFIQQSDDEEQAISVAGSNFIWFQQLQRSYRDEMRNDDDFQVTVFSNISDGNITRTEQLKRLKDVYKYKDAWALFKKGDIDAAQDLAKFYLREEKARGDPDPILTNVNARLNSLLQDNGRIDRASDALLTRFHELAEQVPGHVGDVNARIDFVIGRLGSITSSELVQISAESIVKVQKALERVLRQAKSTS